MSYAKLYRIPDFHKRLKEVEPEDGNRSISEMIPKVALYIYKGSKRDVQTPRCMSVNCLCTEALSYNRSDPYPLNTFHAQMEEIA